MSTTTNFKRIALVAVAALGMGVLSSVPSQAAFVGSSTVPVTLATTAGSATISKSDSTTAGTFSLVALAGAVTDSVAITTVGKSKPTGANYPALQYLLQDTATSTSVSLIAIRDAHAATIRVARVNSTLERQLADTTTEFSIAPAAAASANTYIGGTWLAYMDSNTASAPRLAGTYVYTIISTTTGSVVQTVDITFTVAAATEASTTIAPGSSTAFIGTATAATSDAVISALATASTTAAAYVRVVTKNASGIAKPESITATISGAGVLNFGGISGASLTVAGDGGSDISVLPNGVAGTATITITTTTRSFPAKTMTFYAAKPSTLVASVATPLVAIGTNSDVVRVTAKDSAGVSWAGQLYIYASEAADAAIAGSASTAAVACTWDAADDRHECPVAGNAAGKAKMKVFNYSTAALSAAADLVTAGSTVTSNEVSVVVSQASAATVKLEFDKTSYAPGERARIYVTALDSTGKAMQATAFSNLLATGGVATASALTFAGSTTTADSLTAVAITTKGNSSSTSGAKAGSMEYTVYMPVSGGTITISATGGSSLPIAGRVAVTATATVSDSGAAALAAVTALATTVASLKTLITTLTNLVLKIQKKVKA